METWKLDTWLNDFREACAAHDTSAMLKTAKRLRQVAGLRYIATQILDDYKYTDRPEVRQLVYCILLNYPIRPSSELSSIGVKTENGTVYLTKEDRQLRPTNIEQSKGWQQFVARHNTKLEQNR